MSYPYMEIFSHTQHSPNNEEFSPVLLGYHNDKRNSCDNNADHRSPQISYMEEVSNDFNSQKLMNINSFLKICEGCGENICDKYLLFALDRYWHNSCLKCNRCGAMLAEVGRSCFTRRGLILCKKDYSSMFGSSGTCSGCGETIPPNEMVAKATHFLNNPETRGDQRHLFNGVFHLKCFSCTKCGSHLRPGDRYTMIGASLVCEQDFQKLVKSAASTNNTFTSKKGKVGRPRRTKE